LKQDAAPIGMFRITPDIKKLGIEGGFSCGPDLASANFEPAAVAGIDTVLVLRQPDIPDRDIVATFNGHPSPLAPLPNQQSAIAIQGDIIRHDGQTARERVNARGQEGVTREDQGVRRKKHKRQTLSDSFYLIIWLENPGISTPPHAKNTTGVIQRMLIRSCTTPQKESGQNAVISWGFDSSRALYFQIINFGVYSRR
jgi:hypothetical protein